VRIMRGAVETVGDEYIDHHTGYRSVTTNVDARLNSFSPRHFEKRKEPFVLEKTKEIKDLNRLAGIMLAGSCAEIRRPAELAALQAIHKPSLLHSPTMLCSYERPVQFTLHKERIHCVALKSLKYHPF
jgi:hypothetical protein